jgi:outer membrane biogenesis lipoprotein LolB
MRNQTMKVRLLLALLLTGLLCGCAANTPYSETVVDTEKHTQQRGLPETPVYGKPVFTPGSSEQPGLGAHY